MAECAPVNHGGHAYCPQLVTKIERLAAVPPRYYFFTFLLKTVDFGAPTRSQPLLSTTPLVTEIPCKIWRLKLLKQHWRGFQEMTGLNPSLSARILLRFVALESQ